ncbi:MAG: DOPA 4,5-dioxygenase family protein [Pseudomonadota bacterium]
MTDIAAPPTRPSIEPTLLIKSYHAHVYFDADTRAQAEALRAAAEARFDLVAGRMHDRPVGPHPAPSFQLGCSPKVFAELLPWLALNRAGLVVFAHPETGDHMKDHRDHAIWLGAGFELDLSIFD